VKADVANNSSNPGPAERTNTSTPRAATEYVPPHTWFVPYYTEIVTANGSQWNKFLIDGYWEKILEGLKARAPIQHGIILELCLRLTDAMGLIFGDWTTSDDAVEIDIKLRIFAHIALSALGVGWLKPSIVELILQVPAYIADLRREAKLLGMKADISPRNHMECGAETGNARLIDIFSAGAYTRQLFSST